MVFSSPVVALVEQRFSCRSYARRTLPFEACRVLGEAAEAQRAGPLGSPLRFRLVAARADDAAALRGLGTYGFIRDPAGFIVGAARAGDSWLEDFGYALEELVLFATALGLGTCWLGGTFSRGSFSRSMQLEAGESIPAVVSVGVIEEETAARSGTLRRLAGGSRRKPWEELFFDADGAPLDRAAAGGIAPALDAVRLAPSASNRQPWRLVRVPGAWHFFLARTPGYGGGLAGKLLGIADLQRADIGIAMCHFGLVARELALAGRWARRPEPPPAGLRAEYVVSWEEQA